MHIQGYGRQGAAYHGMGMLEKAKEAYLAGLKVEPGTTETHQNCRVIYIMHV